jgi:hypothetical protein
MRSRAGSRRQRRVPGGSPRRINVRTTAAIHDRLKDLAKGAGISLPRYLVESALHDPESDGSMLARHQIVEWLETIEIRLIRQGVNLNQLAADAHHDVLPEHPRIRAVLVYVEQTLDQLTVVLDRLDPDRDRR